MNKIGKLLQSIINRIFKVSHNESTNIKQLTDGKKDNFRKKLKTEYQTQSPIFQYDIEELNKVIEENAKNTQYELSSERIR